MIVTRHPSLPKDTHNAGIGKVQKTGSILPPPRPRLPRTPASTIVPTLSRLIHEDNVLLLERRAPELKKYILKVPNSKRPPCRRGDPYEPASCSVGQTAFKSAITPPEYINPALITMTDPEDLGDRAPRLGCTSNIDKADEPTPRPGINFNVGDTSMSHLMALRFTKKRKLSVDYFFKVINHETMDSTSQELRHHPGRALAA